MVGTPYVIAAVQMDGTPSFSALLLSVGVVSMLVAILYVVLLLRFIRGWVVGSKAQKAVITDSKSLSSINPQSAFATSTYFSAGLEITFPTVSVVVVCHNEAHQLPSLIDALKAQTIKDFELIWVDDHSNDTTQLLMQSTINYMQDVKVLVSSGTGKKQGLRTGIEAAKGDLILVTDADCQPAPGWLEAMMGAYKSSSADVLIGPVTMVGACRSSSADVLKGPVAMVDVHRTSSADVVKVPVKMSESPNITSLPTDRKSCWKELQQLEFATLVASGMAGAAAGKPFIANGANMGFKKSVWLMLHNQLLFQRLSGDDVFLIHAVKQQKGLIHAVFDPEAMVKTRSVTSISAFFRQRRRWLSKAPAYRDKDILFTQWVVAGINLWMLMVAIALPFNTVLMGLLLPLGFVKLVLDAVFISRFSAFFGINPRALNVVILFIIYPFYVFSLGLTLLKSPKHW